MSRRLLYLLLLLARMGSVQAQSLGEETILSRLGDPVEVEIEVRDWQNIELSRTEIVNATQQQYEAFGLVYQPLLDTLSFNLVGPNLAGEVKILVSSREPVEEPFLELLLSLRWPDGSALREYVLLFDPPEPDPRVSTAAPPQPAPAPPVAGLAAPAEQPGLPRSREEAGRAEYRVRYGDTLWTIARQFQPAGIAENLYQFVLSLHAINPDAFIDGNISLLKADAELQIPSARDLAAINPASAQTVFDQRWLDATRAAQLAAEPELAQQPLISPVGNEALATPAVVETVEQSEPELPPGTELSDLEKTPPLLVPSTAAVVPASAGAGVAAATATPAVGEEPSPANTALQQITQKATAIRDLLQVRQQRLAAVEQQILALRSQLQQAENHAGGLAVGLPQSAEVTRQAIMLGLVAAVLLIALAATVMTALRWNRELQAKALKTAAKSRRQ